MNIIPFPTTSRLLPGFAAAVAATRSTPSAPIARVKPLDEVLAAASDRSDKSAPAEKMPLSLKDGHKAMEKLRAFINPGQWKFIRSLMRGEEGIWFIEKAIELAALIEAMPSTYQTDGQGDDAICHLHYFGGSYDGYIIEKDCEEPENPAEAQWQAYGFARWQHHPDQAESGFICLPEIFKSHVELDLHFTPKPLREIKKKFGMAFTPPACHAATAESEGPMIGSTHPHSALVEDHEIAPTPADLQAPFIAMEDGYQPGAIIVSSWGNEQTNKDFYQITRRSGEWITFIRLSAIKTREKDPSGTDAMRGTSLPGGPIPYQKPIRRRLNYRPGTGETRTPIGFTVDHGWSTLWTGKPEAWTDYA